MWQDSLTRQWHIVPRADPSLLQAKLSKLLAERSLVMDVVFRGKNGRVTERERGLSGHALDQGTVGYK